MAAIYTTPNELTGTADWSGGWLHGGTGKPLGTWSSMVANGDTVTVTKQTWGGPSKYVAVKAGETWAFSAEVRGNDCGRIFQIVTLNSATENGHAKADCTRVSATGANPPTGKWQVVSCIWKMTSDGYIRPRVECSANTGTMQVRHYMVTKGTALPAYAPANGETLVASAVSATPTNILAPKADSATGTRWQVDGTGGALTSNAIVHTGVSVETPTAGGANVYVRYADSTGHANAVRAATRAFSAGEVARLCGDATLPAGMTPAGIVCTSALTDIVWSAPSLSIGGAVPLASSAHTPYATQDHVSVTYATKASLKVTDDSITAEVSARAQTDQNVADLSSRLTQTENSLTSEISDRKSAITTVTGLANAAQSTADGAAKQANLYTIDNGDAGHVPKWIHLGTLTSAGDASSATIAVSFGNGYNGRASQNSALTITIKDGSQSAQSATGACGVTAMRENCDDALVDVLAQSATVYDVWVYAPWAYSNGRYSISGRYAAWQHSGATQKTEPATSATQVKQDVAYRLADATKAQTMATENKSSIKQLSDSITSEVTERSKLAGRVGTLESTSDTHTSKLEQLATSIKSLVKGESTYTDPDGKSATSGIYSLVTQTRDSVTALFGQYTKTADLASTQAVKDAKKAGTDAQAAASAAKSTADGLATLIRADSTGVTVGKSADGKTWSTTRTRMGASAFEVLTKAGEVASSFGEKVIELGKNSQDAVIRMLGGLVTIKATNAGVSDGAWCEISTDEFVSTNGYHASRIAAGYKDETGFIPQGVAEVMVEGGEGDGGVLMYAGAHGSEGNSFAMSPAAYTLNHPEYLLATLMDASKVPESLDTCGPGVFSYDTSTAARPTNYGTCVCIRAGDGTTSTWLFEFALPTVGDPLWRRNINGAGWSSWWTITSQ